MSFRNTEMRRRLVALWFVTVFAVASHAGQPAGGDFLIVSSTIDGGGGTSAGGSYVLTGTVGQPDAGTMTASGGEFALAGGFWAQVGEFFLDLIFGDGFE